MKRVPTAAALGGAILFALCATASAEPDASPIGLYEGGRFLAAAAAAEREGGASALILASRAAIAEAITGGGDVDVLLDRAERAAAGALRADPASAEARLQLALALGMKGRKASLTESFQAGYAQRARRLIDEAEHLAPNEPWVHALRGCWNIEIVRRGGAAGAGFFGARLDRGIESFERALRLAPDDPLIAYQYAIALLDYDGARYRTKVLALLDRAARSPAEDALSRRVIQMSKDVRATMQSHGLEAAERLATARFS